MTVGNLALATNPDLGNSLTGLRRAVLMACEVSVRTEPAIVTILDGDLVAITAEELRRTGIR